MSAPVQSCQPTPEPVRQHTPTPWTFDRDWYRIPTIFGADGTKVASVEKDERYPTPERAANADLILEAVNSHATLKAQVEELKSTLREIKAKTDGDRPTVNPENAFEHWGKLNAALVSIRGLTREALGAKS